MQNVNLNAAAVEGLANEINKARAIAGEAVTEVKEGSTFLGDKANIVGGLLGAAAAATLELVSPTGTKGSAIAAMATGSVIVLGTRDKLQVMPNTTGTAVATGAITFIASKYVGRSISDYFPGYCYEK